MATTRWDSRAPLELRSVDASRNRYRRYRLTEQGTLFGAMDLIIEWGRLGRIPNVRVERFASPAALDVRRRELLARRRRHGYQEILPLEKVEETSREDWPIGEMWSSGSTLPAVR